MQTIKTFLTCLMLIASATVMAQTTTVKGTVTDKTLGEGEPFATIRIYKQGKTDKAVAMFLTDKEGAFSHEVEGKGTHDLVVSSIGKADLHHTITLGEKAVLDLGTLTLSDDAKTLSGVEVVAQKPLVKMDVDKMSYRVEDDADAQSSTVLDMLRKVPMVTVDGQDNISVNGSSSFKVYVDGKPNAMFSTNPSMIFKSMPATAVKSIEVVTNPGAKYDAEGASGVLNIVLNKQMAAAGSLNGLNGTVRASAGTNATGLGIFVSGQQNKLSYSANVMTNYSYPKSPEVNMDQMNGATGITSHYDTDTKLPFNMGNISMGYDLDEKSSINTTLSTTLLNMHNKGTYTTNMGTAANGFAYNSKMDMKNNQTALNWNIDYQRFFNPDRTKSFTISYQLSYSPTKNEQRNDFDMGDNTWVDLTDRYSISKNRTTEHTLQLDYTTPIAQGQTLSTGAKAMLRRASSDSKYYLSDVYNEQMSMDYLYKNNIAALYAEYENRWGSASAKAGLRYEHTWQDVEYRLGNGSNFSKDYGTLVPSAALSYSLAPTRNIGLTYNMRISRPGITYLNPYIDRSDPNSLTYGNTDLDVEKSHNVSLVYNMFSQKLMLNVNLRHTYTGNTIEQYSFYDNNLLNTTYGNIVKRNQTGVTGYLNWLATKDTRLFFNGGLNYTDLRSDVLDANNGGWQATAMMGVQQTLPWNLKAAAYLITSTKTYTLQGWSSGFNLVTASLSKSLLNDKMTIGVQAVTGLSEGGSIKMETYSKGSNFSQKQSIKVPISGVSLTLSYTFGKNRQQTRMHQTRIQSDYIEQQSQGEMLNSVGSGTGTGAGAGAGAGGGMPM
ncbi:MAG: TonB-dependent receptor [Prevotella sp.]|nr:TonB-dependent receptor [Prevotella sp.]